MPQERCGPFEHVETFLTVHLGELRRSARWPWGRLERLDAFCKKAVEENLEEFETVVKTKTDWKDLCAPILFTDLS